MSTKPLVLDKPIAAGEIAWSAPSNIALVKYWGKYGVQLPKNPSVSFTLNNAKTTTRLYFEFNKIELSQTMPIEFFFHGERHLKFEAKIQKYFESLLERFPFLSQLKFKIESENTFPSFCWRGLFSFWYGGAWFMSYQFGAKTV